MKHSEQLNELAAALSKAQGQIKGAIKGESNTFFKSKYADLSACWEACREALTANQIAVIQMPGMTAEGATVETMLVHSSGQWVAETLTLPVAKQDAQGVGSAITYGRRYGLCAAVGIAPEDDDGNAAAASVNNQARASDVRERALSALGKAAKAGSKVLAKTWKDSLPPEARKTITEQEFADFKAKAEEVDNATAG